MANGQTNLKCYPTTKNGVMIYILILKMEMLVKNVLLQEKRKMKDIVNIIQKAR